jgi:hypothetical protein
MSLHSDTLYPDSDPGEAENDLNNLVALQLYLLLKKHLLDFLIFLHNSWKQDRYFLIQLFNQISMNLKICMKNVFFCGKFLIN